VERSVPRPAEAASPEPTGPKPATEPKAESEPEPPEDRPS
jgi:hypothetical protein